MNLPTLTRGGLARLPTWLARPAPAAERVEGADPARGVPLSPVALGALLLLLAGWLLLAGLGDPPLAVWDEARLAVNALEMRQTGDLLVTRYGGAPDLWNTKPPLLIWIQAAMLGVFDRAEFAVRLPAALATIGTVLAVFVFLARELGDAWPGMVAGLVLLGTPAFIGYHAGRSGDYDALLVLWTTLYCCAWFRYGATGHRAPLGAFAAALALAMLTKGIAGLLMTPGLLLFTLLEGKMGRVLRDKAAWTAVAAALAVGLGWYALREWAAPGYVAAVLANEVGSFGRATDGTRADALYLLAGIADRRFTPWIYFLPLAWLLAWLSSRRLAIWATCLLVAFFAVVENSSTKLSWYDLPAYPIAATLFGLAAAAVLRQGLASLAPQRPWLVPAAIVAGLSLPLAASDLRVMAVDWHADSRLDYGESMARLGAGPVTVLDGGIPNSAGLPNYNATLLFYAERASERGVDVRIVHPGDRLALGQRFLTCDPDALAAVRLRFVLGAESRDGACLFESVVGVRTVAAAAGRDGGSP